MLHPEHAKRQAGTLPSQHNHWGQNVQTAIKCCVLGSHRISNTIVAGRFRISFDNLAVLITFFVTLGGIAIELPCLTTFWEADRHLQIFFRETK